ncbi:MAG: non-heme iron oxygenase ferredoxin subunit [Rhodospirillaceae bacterium]|nr:non-heme iron oxygenase ferredoxin subunit [Rhodospirillaceae bacterium]
MTEIVRVCSTAELAPGTMRRAPTKLPIAVYNIGGAFYATSDYCTHETSSLCDEGYLDGDEIECGWHCAKFNVKTGAVTAPPATKPLPTYEVRIENGDLYVVVPSA